MSVQWKPNLITSERRLCLTRITGVRGTVGDGKGYSWKLSVSLCWLWNKCYVGALVCPDYSGWVAWVCLLPCVPIRIHYHRSYGGIFP